MPPGRVNLGNAVVRAAKPVSDASLSGRIQAGAPQSEKKPSNPAETLRQGVGKVMAAAFKPIEDASLAIAKSTNAIAQALPSFPAATMGRLAMGVPHAHLHPPVPPVPLPVIGPIALGCCLQVQIGGMPAARVGDMGFNPTCGGIPIAGFEIFTGSSNVYIGGMRAARMGDVTMHCWPPKEWMARGAIAALVAAAKAAMLATMAAGIAAQVAGIISDSMQASAADEASQKAAAAEQESLAQSQAAMASAQALSASMAAAQMAADAAAMAVGALMGKDPAVGSPTGMIMMGNPNVMIGGFPMPSGMQIMGRALAGARRVKTRRKSAPAENKRKRSCGCPNG